MTNSSELLAYTLKLAAQIQQTPAPTFSEAQRAHLMFTCFEAEELVDISLDVEGNVYARFPKGGEGDHPPLVVSAHLDTVFPPETDLFLTQSAETLAGPGIGDNSLGLASLLALARLLRQRSIRLPGDLWLVANAGEEGLGNLRGMKAVVDRFGASSLAYIIVEGMGLGRVFHRGLGVQRYRISVQTRGGHSWIDYGEPSAIHELARLITQITGLPLPTEPRTTLNVGIITGGTSINTIASRAYLELDLRSESEAALTRLVSQIEDMVLDCNQPGIVLTNTLIGSRPHGEIPANHWLVTLAQQCLQEQGIHPMPGIGSTDANIPLSRGLPAICIGLTQGKGAHTLDETIQTRPLATGIEQLFQLVTRVWDAAPKGPSTRVASPGAGERR
jgi:tripeptide aminopeptidase